MNTIKQPKGIFHIIAIQMWEFFSYYGMRSLLILFLTEKLLMSDQHAYALYGAYTSLVYVTPIIGGYLADKYLGNYWSVVLGSLLMVGGHFVLSIPSSDHSTLYLALSLIICGNGLFKANPSSLLAKVYDQDDKRLDGAFTMYYMAINLGSFFSMLLTPWIASQFGYGMAFSVSAVGLIITVINFLMCSRMVKGVGSEPDLIAVNKTRYLGVVIGAVALSFLCSVLLQHLFYAHAILVVVGVTIVALYMKEAFKIKGLERAKMLVAFALMLQGVVFFVLYFQMPTSLNFFAIHNIEHNLFGISVAPEQFQALNPFWIMIASPILAIAYNNLGERFAMPYKFAFGMVLCALSFLVLKFGASFANADGIMSSNWLVVCYAFQSLGELLVSGLGLAMVAQLVPQRMMGFAMGMWFLTSATAAVIAGWVATLTTAPAGLTDANQTLAIYSDVFGKIGYANPLLCRLYSS
ncbi:UNVERIFIED_CONTAM: hypothetical protein GTU68_009131 [Idotea baltica]|nr:hypothetical protein [Idotea baltica]